MALKTVFLLLHVLGVISGVGGVLMLDVHLLRHLRGAVVTAQDVKLTQFVSVFVKAGLIVVWLSGLVIISIAADGPASVLANPKMQAKLVVVVVLTINALFIETLALPLMGRNVGRPLFHGVGQARRSTILACGAVSTLSWLYPIALGLARELNQVVPAQVILTYYALCLACLAAALQVAGRVFYRPKLGPLAATGESISAESGRDERVSELPAIERQARRHPRPGGDADLRRRPNGSDETARQAGRRAFQSGMSTEGVAYDFAALSMREQQEFRAGLFEALRERHVPGTSVERLIESVADSDMLRAKFAVVAPHRAAREAFASTMDEARRRIDDTIWSQVRKWHEILMHPKPATGSGPFEADSTRNVAARS